MTKTDELLREFVTIYKSFLYYDETTAFASGSITMVTNEDAMLSDLRTLIKQVEEERMGHEGENMDEGKKYARKMNLEQGHDYNSAYCGFRNGYKWLRSRLTCSEKPNNSQKTEGGAK